MLIMLGVVLCGGQSNRMGADKGLLRKNEITWAETAARKFDFLRQTVILSVNQDQIDNYAKLFPSYELVTDNPNLQLNGPLCGLLSVHLHYPEQDLFVLACDMPLMEPSILEELFIRYQAGRKAEAYVFINNGQAEPLCAIYTAKALKHIAGMHQKKQLIRHSMKFALEQMVAALYPIPIGQQIYFNNINTHEELNKL
jgi:molybdenum cofactor guanylyltransferase